MGGIYLLLVVVVIAVIIGIPIGLKVGSFVGKHFAEFLSSEPQEVSKSYSVANVFLVKGKYAEAIEAYRRELEEDAEDITAQLKIAEIYDHKMKDFSQAIPEYEELLTMKEVEDNLWISVKNRLADIYSQQLENGAEALRQLREIVERFPETQHAYQARQRISKIKVGKT